MCLFILTEINMNLNPIGGDGNHKLYVKNK